MFAAIDSLITLLIFVGVAIVSAILNRRREREQQDYSDLPRFPQPEAPAPQRPRKTWEDELRELLEEAKPSARPETPPPVIYAPPPPPLPVPERARHGFPTPHPAPAWETSGETEEDILAHFKDASARFSAAGQLHERVARQLQEAAEHRSLLTSVTRRPGAVATSEAAKLVHDPKNLRNAILAQVILGQPRALDEA